MWEIGTKGKMWTVVRSMYVNNMSYDMPSEFFSLKQGAQGCTLSRTLFLIYINGLLLEIEECPELSV